MKFPVLMYHRVVAPGCPVPGGDAEETRYAVAVEDFERQLDAIVAAGRVGVSLRDVHERLALGQAVPRAWVGITFDDGNESDLRVALPALEARGFGATFYVCGNRLGVCGGLRADEVGEISARGFHVGSHGMTHRFFNSLSGGEQADELLRSRTVLEGITGGAVDHFAPPGGRYTRDTLAALTSTGYKAMATSAFGFNRSEGARRVYRRIPVVAATDSRTFGQFVAARRVGLWRLYTRHAALGMARRVLGESGYRRVRSLGIGR